MVQVGNFVTLKPGAQLLGLSSLRGIVVKQHGDRHEVKHLGGLTKVRSEKLMVSNVPDDVWVCPNCQIDVWFSEAKSAGWQKRSNGWWCPVCVDSTVPYSPSSENGPACVDSPVLCRLSSEKAASEIEDKNMGKKRSVCEGENQFLRDGFDKGTLKKLRPLISSAINEFLTKHGAISADSDILSVNYLANGTEAKVHLRMTIGQQDSIDASTQRWLNEVDKYNCKCGKNDVAINKDWFGKTIMLGSATYQIVGCEAYRWKRPISLMALSGKHAGKQHTSACDVALIASAFGE